MLEIFITIFLVLLNGFFVAAEFAIVKVRYSQIQIKAEQGNRFAKKSEHIINNLDTYLSATQLGITLASLGLGWIGEPVVSKIISTILVYLGVEISPETLHSISLPVGFLVITVLHIVFGELAPKSIAIRKPEKATLFVAYPLEWFFYAFKPFIWLMNSISNGFLSLIGIKPIGEHEIHSTEELKILVQQSKDGGAIQDENYEIIKNAFDFTDHKAKQIMVPRQQVFAFDIKLSVEEIIEEIYKIGYSRIPVYENSIDNIIGVLYSKEVLKSYYKNPDFKINELLHKVHYVFESKRISEILTEFQKLHIHLAVIIDEFGGTQGIITLEDIIEELVGEIQDEDDDEKPIVEKKDDETYIIQATQSLADINEFLKYPFKLSENYQTLAGLLLSKLNRVPKVDEKIVYENYELTILKLQRGTIQSVQLKNIKPNINKLIEIIKLDKK
jgi:CBS domain containing-hemolysin-like protein